jgi:glycosyltransferase involved in cell wall biosynthesis
MNAKKYAAPQLHDPIQTEGASKLRNPLRIGMVSYSFYENDNRVMRYAETLARQGNYVDVFALQREDLPSEEIMNGVHVHRLQKRKVDEKSRFSYLHRILGFLVRATYHVSAKHFHHKYDLLHIHSVPDFMVFAGLLPRITGVPVILDIHDILPEFYTSKFGTKTNSLSFRLLLAVEKLSSMFSSHVIIANHIWQQRLISRCVKPEKCTVVLNSPDRSIFHAHDVGRHANGRFVLLYPGTLNWHQGLDLAIRAFARIRDQVPHADFYIYGDGPSKNELSLLIKTLGLQDRVFLCKQLPLREIPKIIANADLGIVPKRKDAFGNEAFSTKILEFMAIGVPVIVADTQVDRYYFDDSVVCFFRGGEEEDLACRMLNLIRDPDHRKLLVANAARFVETVDWTAKQHEYLSLVDRLVATPHRR